MQNIFLYLFNTSITASYIIIAVILIRLLLSKAPKVFRLILWAAVGLGLIIPISIESSFSILPKSDLLPEEIVYSNSAFEPTISDIFKYAGNNPVSYSVGLGSDGSMIFTEFTAPDSDYLNPLLIIVTIASVLWLAGFSVMLLYALISGLRLHRTVRASIRLRDEIMICDNIHSPFILGIFNPKIYIPSDTDPSQLPFIEQHERAHLARLDHLWKLVGFFLLSVYWFNPLVWAGYILFCRDIEFACDERAICKMSLDDKKNYSMALLSYSIGIKNLPSYPLAFGETNVKKRVKNVIKYKKPTVLVIIIALVLLIVFGVCFFTKPASTTLNAETEAYLHHAILDYHTGDYYTPENSFACEDHIILKAEKKGDVTTVYALVMYLNFSCENGILTEVSGCHIPSVITLDMSGFGYSYNYQHSEDGTRYVPSIREMFPWYLEDKAINIHKTASEQNERCIRQAEKHFGVKYIDPYANTTHTTNAYIAEN